MKPSSTKPRATTNSGWLPMILHHLKDGDGRRWICYGRASGYVWVEQADFLESNVFKRLVRVDPQLLEKVKQRQLIDAVSRITESQAGVIALAPGWAGSYFVPGYFENKGDPAQSAVIAAFEPMQKFRNKGTLGAWQAGIGPYVTKQDLALFVLSLALAGAIHPFIPPDYITPFFELVGDPGKGKTTFGVLAASVWAGDEQSTTGGGETWNFSPRRIGELKLSHRHMFLLLDEGNLAGQSLDEQAAKVKSVGFELTDSSQRKVAGEKADAPESYLTVLSTTNLPIGELLRDREKDQSLNALLQRIITIRVPSRPLGVFERLPVGSKHSGDAAEKVRAEIDTNYGSAGQAFTSEIQRRLREDPARFRASLRRRLERERSRLAEAGAEERIQKAFALVATAGWLACKSGVLPLAWGKPHKSVRAVAAANRASPKHDAVGLAAVKDYLKRYALDIVNGDELEEPHLAPDFERIPGYSVTKQQSRWLYVSTEFFQNNVSCWTEFLNAAAREGLLHSEGGVQRKRSVKVPRRICVNRRAYCFKISH